MSLGLTLAERWKPVIDKMGMFEEDDPERAAFAIMLENQMADTQYADDAEIAFAGFVLPTMSALWKEVRRRGITIDPLTHMPKHPRELRLRQLSLVEILSHHPVEGDDHDAIESATAAMAVRYADSLEEWLDGKKIWQPYLMMKANIIPGTGDKPIEDPDNLSITDEAAYVAIIEDPDVRG